MDKAAVKATLTLVAAGILAVPVLFLAIMAAAAQELLQALHQVLPQPVNDRLARMVRIRVGSE